MEEKSKKFSDLVVWQKAHNLVIEVYKLTQQFPKEEMFGLTSQIRRAVISVPANIAEGFARKGIKDKLRFYNIADGSLNEVSYYLFLSKELGYPSLPDLNEKVEIVGKMLNAYSKSLQNNTK